MVERSWRSVSPVPGIMPISGRISTYPRCADFPSQLCHPAHEPFHVAAVYERDADGATASALGTAQIGLDLVEIELGEVWIGGKAIAGLVARMSAGTAGDFEPGLAVEIGEFEIDLPVHQKSSAEGMRVYEILPRHNRRAAASRDRR